MNLPQPKARFLKTPAAKDFAAMAAHPVFAAAVECALAQLQSDVATADAPDKFSADQRFFMLHGAQRFSTLLATIGDPETKPPKRPDDNLLTHE